MEGRSPGRPGLPDDTIRRRYADAIRDLGGDATVERIAEYLDVTPRTVRRWKERIDVR